MASVVMRWKAVKDTRHYPFLLAQPGTFSQEANYVPGCEAIYSD